MSKSQYTIGDLFGNKDFHQIVIPEIQRDYVWSIDNVEKLLISIIEDAKKQAEKESRVSEALLNALSPEEREDFIRFQEKTKTISNVGFIYAYEDKELKRRIFLIDGQQRLTTLYLILLATAIVNDKFSYFRSRYFDKGIPKIGYKVRESAHDFIRRFVDYLLSGGKLNDVKNQYWYLKDFENDRTIRSVLRNYEYIFQYINERKITLEFLEKNVEMWFFDIDKSSQGEELYIYMNSRGETVQANENIKAELLEGLSEEEKIKGGEKWETWQNFFWKNKDDNSCADEGFNEFLRWIKIIEQICRKPEKSVAKHSNYIKSIRVNQKFDSRLLSIEIINKYYNALHNLNKHFETVDFSRSWLKGYASQADYFRFLPVLLYCSHYQIFDFQNVKRLSRFFKNVIQLPDVAKNPDDQTVNAIKLMTKFIDNEYKDVTDLAQFKEISEFKTILTKEEVFKLELYAAQDIPEKREAVEKEFWKCEDFSLNAGRIELVLYCSGQKLGEVTNENFKLNKFRKYSDAFFELFSNRSDKFLRALLTKGDYTIKDGYSTNLWADRYTFGNNVVSWKKILSYPEHQKYIKRLLKDFIQLKSNGSESNQALEEIISTYLNNSPKKDWIYQFISNPKALKYCQEKKFVWGGEDFDKIYLMRRTKATDYKKLSTFIEE
ncbi:DUF262 domain-containing protein [Draconibacterium orientale]|uniref:DUF262 domain-containing protein n=1 Tax=Draconibacterium orientale TaxID=1168034 RepID=UPI0029C0EAD9|nr:DUF262 domain-containing protein [Draconibacterium orientale]